MANPHCRVSAIHWHIDAIPLHLLVAPLNGQHVMRVEYEGEVLKHTFWERIESRKGCVSFAREKA